MDPLVPTFYTNTFQVKKNLPAQDTGPGLTTRIERLIKQEYERQCYKGVYIKAGSVKLVERSKGRIEGSHFRPEITYQVIMECQAYKPINGTQIKAQITGKNKVGLTAQIYPFEIPMKIIMTRKHHSDRLMLLEQSTVGQIVVVTILDYEFQGNQIFTIARLEHPIQSGTQHRYFPINLANQSNFQPELDLGKVELSFGDQPNWLSDNIVNLGDELAQIEKELSELDSEDVRKSSQLFKPSGLIDPEWSYLQDYPNLVQGFPGQRSMFAFQPPALSQHYYQTRELLKRFGLLANLPSGSALNFMVFEGPLSPTDTEEHRATEQQLAAPGAVLQALLDYRLASRESITEADEQVIHRVWAWGPEWTSFENNYWNQAEELNTAPTEAVALQLKTTNQDVSSPAFLQTVKNDLTTDEDIALKLDYGTGEASIPADPAATGFDLILMASNSPIKTVNDLDQQFAGQRQLFAQLALAFLVQRVDGNLALKVSGLASDFQAELLGLLNQYYSRVAIYQALTTPLTESGDQWLVATGFKGFPVDDVLEPVTRATWFDFSTQTLQNWSTATNSRFPVSVFNWGPLMEEFKNILDNASQQLMTQRLTYLRTLAAHARGERQMDQVEQQSLQRTQAIKWAQDFLAPEDYDHQLLLPPTIN